MNHTPPDTSASAIIPQSQLPATAVVLIVTVKALPRQETAVRQALLDMVAPSRAEPGCHCYNLHEAKETEGLFTFYEQWASPAALDAHVETPHFLALGSAIAGRTEPLVLAFQSLLG